MNKVFIIILPKINSRRNDLNYRLKSLHFSLCHLVSVVLNVKTTLPLKTNLKNYSCME